MVDLLPCPWCGETKIEPLDATRILGMWNIIHRCPVIGPFKIELSTREAVISIWNTRALPSATQDGVQVKPLVWMPYPNIALAGPDVAVADAQFSHRYQVQRDPWSASYMAYLRPTLPITSGTLWWESKGHATLETAKAAAQADYEARILAALDFAPLPPAPEGEG